MQFLINLITTIINLGVKEIYSYMIRLRYYYIDEINSPEYKKHAEMLLKNLHLIIIKC